MWQTSPSTPQQPPAQNRHVRIALVALIVCFWVGAGIVCTHLYTLDSHALLTEQTALLTREARTTVNAIAALRDGLKAQCDRISTSELLRLFAKEQESSGEASLANQKDLLQKVLQDFVHDAGFENASIVSKHGRVLIATDPRAPFDTARQEAVVQAINSRAMRFAPLRATPDGLTADFALPLQPQLARDTAEKPVAALLVSAVLADRFTQHLSATDTIGHATALRVLQHTPVGWQTVSLQGVAGLDVHIVPERKPNNTIVFAKRKSLIGAGEVYSLGLHVPDSEWWVMASVPAESIHALLRGKAIAIGTVGVLLSVVFALLLPLFWWLAVGRHQHTTALHFRAMYHIIERQKQLLDSINLSLGVGLFMVDKDGTVRFCNNTFCTAVDTTEDLATGKDVRHFFPTASQDHLVERMEYVLGENKSTSFEARLVSAGEERLYRMTLFPYLESESDVPRGVVGTMQDITEFRRNAQRQQRQQAHTLSALVRAIEGLDPYLVGHSQMMQGLGALVAQRMNLTPSETRTLETAASLSQVGRLALPHSLATKQGRFTEAELAEMRRVPEYALNILRDIDFDMPVAETVYTMYERLDGSGYPQGLRGEESVSPCARVLAVLNVFCAMTSPRSYQEAKSPTHALEILRDDTGFDHNVVQFLHGVMLSSGGYTYANSHTHHLHSFIVDLCCAGASRPKEQWSW